MGAYHQLWQIEKSFRMSKIDLRSRPAQMPERSLSIRSPIFAVAQRDSTDWLPERLPARSPPVSSARPSLMINSTGAPFSWHRVEQFHACGRAAGRN
jgi:hypothetical protein